MRKTEPVTQTIRASDASQAFNQIIKRVSKLRTRIVVEEDGATVAAIVSADDLARLMQLDRQRDADLAILDASQAAFADVPEDELIGEIERSIAEVRADARARGGAQPA